MIIKNNVNGKNKVPRNIKNHFKFPNLSLNFPFLSASIEIYKK